MLTLFFTCVHTLNVIFTLFTWLFPTHPSKLCWKIFSSVKSSGHFQTVTHTVLTLGASPPGCLSTLRSLCFNYSVFPFHFGLLNCELVSSWNLKYFCCWGVHSGYSLIFQELKGLSHQSVYPIICHMTQVEQISKPPVCKQSKSFQRMEHGPVATSGSHSAWKQPLLYHILSSMILSYFTSMCLSFLFCKMKTTSVPTL